MGGAFSGDDQKKTQVKIAQNVEKAVLPPIKETQFHKPIDAKTNRSNNSKKLEKVVNAPTKKVQPNTNSPSKNQARTSSFNKFKPLTKSNFVTLSHPKKKQNYNPEQTQTQHNPTPRTIRIRSSKQRVSEQRAKLRAVVDGKKGTHLQSKLQAIYRIYAQ